MRKKAWCVFFHPRAFSSRAQCLHSLDALRPTNSAIIAVFPPRHGALPPGESSLSFLVGSLAFFFSSAFASQASEQGTPLDPSLFFGPQRAIDVGGEGGDLGRRKVYTFKSPST